MNADGSGQTWLTNSGATMPCPTGRPTVEDRLHQLSGRQLRDLRHERRRQRPDTLTNDIPLDSDPAWSPDGSKIAFISSRDGAFEIYVMNADGSGQTRLTNGLADNAWPSWSPDGPKIAFFSNRDGNYEIYVMQTPTAPARRT